MEQSKHVVTAATDLPELPSILEKTLGLANEFLMGLKDRATAITAPKPDWLPLPETGYGAMAVQELFPKQFLPLIVASAGPRYWGFVTGGTTPAALAGDWLTSVFDQNTQHTTGAGDCSALLEIQTVQLLLDLLGLPDDFMGACVSGATMSNFTGMAVARQWYGRRRGIDIAREGLQESIPVFAATPHSSSIKALSMLGMGSSNLREVPCLPGREAMDMQVLNDIIPTNGTPFIIIASGGTVNSVDFDDLEELARIRSRHHCWVHIDAAFGGFAACSPAYRHLLAGWEHADSITVDFHKWLNVPYDSAMIFTRKEHAQLQMETFQNSAAPYLGDPWAQFSYLNYVPENSRRFRALPAWFTLMAYGRQGYQKMVENNIRLANLLADKLTAGGWFRLLAPVRLNTVCFTIGEEHTKKLSIPGLLQELNKGGVVFMTPSVYKGESCIRAALVNYRTTENDIEIAMTAIEEAIHAIYDQGI